MRCFRARRSGEKKILRTLLYACQLAYSAAAAAWRRLWRTYRHARMPFAACACFQRSALPQQPLYHTAAAWAAAHAWTLRE